MESRFAIRCLVFPLLALFVGAAILACDLSTFLPSSGVTQAQPTQPSSAPATVASAQPTTAAQQPTAVSKPVTPTGGRDTPFGKVTDPSELNSYRARILMEVRKKDGTKPEPMRLTMEWIKNPPSQHIVMGEGAQALETISIGDKVWVKMGGNWIESSASQSPSASALPESYLPEQDVKVQALGDDTVSGIRCKKHSYSGKVTITIPAIQNRPATKMTFNVKGEMCIANQPGLPPVVLREKGEIEGNLFGMLFQAALGGATKSDGSEITYVERELYDINAAIAIKPPENVMQVPGVPTIPGGKPSVIAKPSPSVKPTVAGKPSTVAPQATLAAGAPLFADEFNGTLDSKWVWTDPTGGSSHNVKARSGFLRLSTPDGNDMWVGNYDAPRLLRSVNGNFIVETLVEFNPTKHYQGAGILIYQDDDNFLRLERGFGGLAPIGSNVSFVKEGDGLIGDAAPTNATRVELRVQRVGNQFTAWWREPNKAWQQMGSTELDLQSDVQVGVLQVANWDVDQINADFDYFRISRPR